MLTRQTCPLPQHPVSRGLLYGAIAACTLLGACVDAGLDATPAATGDGETADPSGLAAVQRDVDIVLAAASALDDGFAMHPMAPAIATAHGRMSRTMEALALAAEDLRAAATRDAASADRAIRLLSQNAARLAPQVRKLRRLIARAEIDPAKRGELLVRLARFGVAAHAVDSRASELSGALEAPRLEALGVTSTERNGPLFPGSPFFVLDEGHVDAIDAAFEDGEIGITVHDESVEPDVERDPAQVILVVKPSAKIQVPDSRFAFLGPVGATVWLLPQDQLDAQALGLLFLGLSTEEIEPGTFVGDTVDFRFRRVTGPDGLSLFESPPDEETPPAVLVDSEDGLPDIIAMPATTHRHVNWAFESAGIYFVSVDVTGRLAGVAGEPTVTSSKALLKLVVLP